MTNFAISFNDIRAAAVRLDGIAHRTPARTSRTANVAVRINQPWHDEFPSAVNPLRAGRHRHFVGRARRDNFATVDHHRRIDH